MIKQYPPDTVKPSLPQRLFWRLTRDLNIEGVARLFINRNSYLVEQGWFLSSKTAKSVGGHGQPIPWLTYPFTSFIEPRLRKSMSMFEFGCGNSTLWFADRVGTIHSVEHTKDWYEEIRPKLPINVQLTLHEIISDQTYSAITFMEPSDETLYSSAITRTGQLYDVILVDGVYRANSVVNAIRSLKKDGVIFLDNVDYVESGGCTDYLKNAGFKRLDFWGMCPIIHHDSCTAVFYKAENCMGI